MNRNASNSIPPNYYAMMDETRESGFTMASDILTCSLLRTLAGIKPAGKMLELGTGTGLATTWILDGMDAGSTLISVDNDESYLAIAKKFLAHDRRLSLVLADGGEWLVQHKNTKFDYIFADTWHGKYLMLDETLSMLNPGGLYIIDDMMPQPNWPEGHDEKATALLSALEARTDIVSTKMVWATGIVIAAKK